MGVPRIPDLGNYAREPQGGLQAAGDVTQLVDIWQRQNSCGHKRTTFKLAQQRSHYTCKSPVQTKFASFDSGKSTFYNLLNSRWLLFKMIGPFTEIRKLSVSKKI